MSHRVQLTASISKRFLENCIQLGDFLTSDVIKLEADVKMETDDVTSVTDDAQKFDPIILPSAKYLSCTPDRYNALFIISSLIGSQKMPIFNDVIKMTLLAERNPKALELISNSLEILQSEQLISMHQSVVSLIKMIVTGQKLTNQNLNMMKVTWMEEAEKFEILVEKSAKILQISKGSKIAVGSLLGAGLKQTSMNMIDSSLKPLVNISRFVFSHFSSLESDWSNNFDQVKSMFVMSILKMLNSMKEDKVTLLPLWAHWLQKIPIQDDNLRLVSKTIT